jgi:hypothetical protein
MKGEGKMKEMVREKEIKEILSASEKTSIMAKPCPKDIFNREALEDTHDGSMGISKDVTDYLICMNDGIYLHGMYRGGRSSSNYAYSQTVEENGERVHEFIKRQGYDIEDVVFIIEYEYRLHDWEGQEKLEDESLKFIPIISIDWDKVRRRIEDKLRKDTEYIKFAALNSGINLY